MRKPAFCIFEIKGADQLCGNRTADQRLCFHYMASTTPLLKSLSHLLRLHSPGFVSDLVVNPEDRFSRDAAHLIAE